MPVYVLVLLAFIVAVLYSTVGHGGASGYLAAMTLAGMAPAVMKPTALALNILVAGMGSGRYIHAKCFDWKVFWPCALGSIPLAFLGGGASTPDALYKKLLGVFLVLAAIALLLPRPSDKEPRPFPLWAGVAIGAAIGYVSGLIGVGGGIFLSPILILSGWAQTRVACGISALFILVNSVAGLLGNIASVKSLPSILPWLALAAFIGGIIGTELGTRRLSPNWIRFVLCAVMLVAAAKLLLV